MTIEEILSISKDEDIGSIVDVENYWTTDCTSKYFKVVSQALEKQIPCKTEDSTEGGFDWYCKCGTYLSPIKCEEIKYCISCGQKLDWE